LSKPEIIVYTDGACSGNPGPGGWGVYLEFNGKSKTLSGSENPTTNNRMEMRAVIEALRALKKPCKAIIHSDSALIINTFTKGWIKGWLQKNWIKSDKKPVENRDLWEEMLEVMQQHEVVWVKVKGHSTDVKNNLVDRLAVEASKQAQKV